MYENITNQKMYEKHKICYQALFTQSKAFQYNCVIFPQAAPFFLYLKKLKIEIFVPQNIGPSRYMYLGMTKLALISEKNLMIMRKIKCRSC